MGPVRGSVGGAASVAPVAFSAGVAGLVIIGPVDGCVAGMEGWPGPFTLACTSAPGLTTVGGQSVVAGDIGDCGGAGACWASA